MTDSATPIDSTFLEQKHKHFDLLCRNLGLEAGLQENGDGYAIASAAAGTKGTSSVSIGPALRRPMPDHWSQRGAYPDWRAAVSLGSTRSLADALPGP